MWQIMLWYVAHFFDTDIVTLLGCAGLQSIEVRVPNHTNVMKR